MSYLDGRNFVLNVCDRNEVKNRTTPAENTPKRNESFTYCLPDANQGKTVVCKDFFLTTLGYKKNNDRFMFEVLSKTPINEIYCQY